MEQDFLVFMIVPPPSAFSFCPPPLFWFLSHFGYFDDASFDHWIYFFLVGEGGRVEGRGRGGVERDGPEQTTLLGV